MLGALNLMLVSEGLPRAGVRFLGDAGFVRQAIVRLDQMQKIIADGKIVFLLYSFPNRSLNLYFSSTVGASMPTHSPVIL